MTFSTTFTASVLAFGLVCGGPVCAQTINMPAGIWSPDQKDGTYINPVLNGDYSDPDVVRVGDDYYLTASSFTNIPGLPILHSKDLVNWTLVGHALERNVPDGHHSVPRRGGGVWAPAIRHHDGKFYIYYPDPDFGIYVVTATDPKGPWTKPTLVETTKGVIDPAPFWDEDGKAYLAYGFAKSRAGINNTIALKRLSADGTRTEGDAKFIIEADKMPKVKTSYGLMPWFTTEGPKLYKRGGYFYVFVPSGSVKGGWQGVFRAKNIWGPYEGRNVLDQGHTDINGPHQGAWVDTPSINGKAGQDWFLHFQDTDSYGRRVMLEPMTWGKDGWPVIGEYQKGQTYGQPVWRHQKPDLAPQSVSVPVVDDDFKDGYHLGWQWNANPGDDWVDASVTDKLRLKSVSSSVNLWEAGHMLTQKLPGLTFSATTRLSLIPAQVGERAGLLVLGYDYGWIGLENRADGIRLVQVTRPKANVPGGMETTLTAPLRIDGPIYVRISLKPVVTKVNAPQGPATMPSMARNIDAKVQFSYSLDGITFTPMGSGFTSQPGRWVGAQIGLFAQSPTGTPANVATRVGYADFETFKVTP